MDIYTKRTGVTDRVLRSKIIEMKRSGIEMIVFPKQILSTKLEKSG